MALASVGTVHMPLFLALYVQLGRKAGRIPRDAEFPEEKLLPSGRLIV